MANTSWGAGSMGQMVFVTDIECVYTVSVDSLILICMMQILHAVSSDTYTDSNIQSMQMRLKL